MNHTTTQIPPYRHTLHLNIFHTRRIKRLLNGNFIEASDNCWFLFISHGGKSKINRCLNMSPRDADRTVGFNECSYEDKHHSLVSIVLYERWSFFRQEILARSRAIITNLQCSNWYLQYPTSVHHIDEDKEETLLLVVPMPMMLVANFETWADPSHHVNPNPVLLGLGIGCIF